MGAANKDVQEAGGIVGAGSGIAATILTAAAVSGPLAPIVAAGGAVIALLSSFIGGGCGTACTDASQAEQIYEAAVDNLSAVSSKLGMISSAEFISGAQQILASGQQHMEALSAQKQAANGAANMEKDISQMISAAPNTLPPARTAALNVSAAQAVFIGGPGGASTSGWYAGSVAAAAQLATAFLESLPPGGGGPAASPSSATGLIEEAGSVFTDNSASTGIGGTIESLLLWGGLAYLGVKIIGAVI
jgi:hypothetical protein